MISVALDPDYIRLKHHLIESTGLAFPEDGEQPLTELIGERLADLGFRDCSSYTEFLAHSQKGSAEMEILVARLTVGETCFFDDDAQYAAIRDVILPDILERKQSSRQLRIWSAGCAAGAEPYSLAILLMHDLADRMAGWQVGIFATDSNLSSLARAREAKFPARALRFTSDDVKRACFSSKGQEWTLEPRYKQWISFQYLNLAEDDFSTLFAAGTYFDLILCRDAMSRFAPETRRKLAGQFHQSLGDEGWLVAGTAEKDSEIYKSFRTVNASGTKLYQKPASGLREPAPAPVHRADVEGLRQLADRGDWQGVIEYSQQLLSREQSNPAIPFYQALIFENLGIAEESQRLLRQAIRLDGNFALAHYHLGLALKRDRRVSAAVQSFGCVLKILDGAPDHAIVAGGPGVSVSRLRALARMQQEE